MQIKWLRAALLNLQEEHHYIAQDNPTAASKVILRIQSAVALLSDNPGLGRAGRVLGTRELVISGTSYIVPYRVQNDVVEILRIFHARRRWPSELR